MRKNNPVQVYIYSWLTGRRRKINPRYILRFTVRRRHSHYYTPIYTEKTKQKNKRRHSHYYTPIYTEKTKKNTHVSCTFSQILTTYCTKLYTWKQQTEDKAKTNRVHVYIYNWIIGNKKHKTHMCCVTQSFIEVK